MCTIKEKIGVIPIKEIAQSTEFEKRESKKINSEDYVASFIQCVLNGDITQASWRRELSKLIEEPVSEQALQGKVQFRHELFAKKLLEHAIEHVCQVNNAHICCEVLSHFTAIKAHDSTCIKLPIGLMDFFPGSSSRNGVNAMARIQLSMDLLKNSYTKIKITSFRKNDQSYAMEIAQNTSEGELNLFDLGYFKKDLLQELIDQKSYFLSRYFKVCLFNSSKDKEFDLVKKLKSLEKQGVKHLDIQVEMGRKERIPVRLVANRLPQNIAQKRRRRRIEARVQDNRKCYSEEYLYLFGWNIFFTNISPQIASAKELFKIYGLRWRIEIIFKVWKSKFDFAKMFTKQSYRLPSRATIQMNLILFTMIMFLTKWYQCLYHLVEEKTGRLLSILKFSGMVKNQLDYLHNLFQNDQQKLIEILSKQYCYDVRKDRPNFVESLYDKKIT